MTILECFDVATIDNLYHIIAGLIGVGIFSTILFLYLLFTK